MVQTRSAAKRIKSGKVHIATVEHPLENDVPTPAKKPRREDTAAPKKRRRGKPGELCQLNLDVLFLIAAYIHPVDLLNLARTCKSLRELLMDKSSAFVWKTARQQVRSLPDCPADLTEPEYANLVFYARCHGCGKYTTTILWNVRRRFCPGCRIRRLRLLSSCHQIVRKNAVLAVEHILIKKEYSTRVDKDQAASFMHEYRQSLDKEQFISNKQKQCSAIFQHAKKCEAWQQQRESERKDEQNGRRRERGKRIFEHLKQQGYAREIGHFGYYAIEQSRESDFRTCKPLTDKEWDRIWPEWAKVMNNFRSRRLETQVYRPRRHVLVSAYNRYVGPDTPTFDLLPDAASLASLLPFTEIIKAPEETRINDESFASAFAQLPLLVSEWKKKLDAELAEIVQIPLHLSSENATGCRALAPSSTARAESSNAGLDKLHLACALFQIAGADVFTHLEVFSACKIDHFFPDFCRDDSERHGSISDRFGIRFLEEAPNIVHACGLDPNVATVDDMDHRNARLKCLSCEGRTLIMNWRHAMWHAYSYHQSPRTLTPLSKSPCWQLVCEEHIDAIQTVEQSIKGDLFPRFVQCLLCKRRVGDMIRKHNVAYHLHTCHNLKTEGVDDIKQGVHYAPIGICDSQSVAVELVEEGDQVTFRATELKLSAGTDRKGS